MISIKKKRKKMKRDLCYIKKDNGSKDNFYIYFINNAISILINFAINILFNRIKMNIMRINENNVNFFFFFFFLFIRNFLN